MTYAEALARLGARGRLGIRPGLDATREALAAVGSPERALVALHVAGTNGKGSTAAMAEAMLRAAGRRTGLYTSPHLARFTERIRVDGRELAPEVTARLLERVLSLPFELTFFEAATVAALLAFVEAGVEVAVLECGLGGRLDATNLCRPSVTAVTGVALDHQEILGDTPAAIAREKAGIWKAGVPAVLGRVEDPDARRVLEARAAEVGAPLVAWPGDFSAVAAGEERIDYRGPGGALGGAELALAGAHQAHNAAVALAATALLPESLRPDERARRDGLRAVRWPGRLERVAPDVWLDVAHNPDGARALGEALVARGLAPVVLVIGALADKDAAGVLAPLVPLAAHVVGTRPPTPRALGADALAALARGALSSSAGAVVEAIDDPAAALARARHVAAALGRPVVVCGSFYLVGPLRAALTGEALDPVATADPAARPSAGR